MALYATGVDLPNKGRFRPKVGAKALTHAQARTDSGHLKFVWSASRAIIDTIGKQINTRLALCEPVYFLSGPSSLACKHSVTAS
eukprot:3025137-Pleurochrysis_carterae.AAC.2